jgi:putative FmdB family regulatory protein
MGIRYAHKRHVFVAALSRRKTMPIYEYHCDACGHDFEIIEKMSDTTERKCESCGKNQAKRKVSRTSFILKGGGWYAQGYGSSSASSPSSDASSSATCPASKSCSNGSCAAKASNE